MWPRWPRGLQAQQTGPLGDVELPAHPDEREPQTHEQGVSQVCGAGRIDPVGAPVEVGQGRLAAAVADLQQPYTATGAGPLGPQHHEPGPRLHRPGPVGGGLVQVHDASVVGVTGIEPEADAPRELLLGARTGVGLI
jgi:hypothetical protein